MNEVCLLMLSKTLILLHFNDPLLMIFDIFQGPVRILSILLNRPENKEPPSANLPRVHQLNVL